MNHAHPKGLSSRRHRDDVSEAEGKKTESKAMSSR